jgi:hypothetical protein
LHNCGSTKKVRKKSSKESSKKKFEKKFDKKFEKITNCWRGGEGWGGEGGREGGWGGEGREGGWRIVIPMPEAINEVEGRMQKWHFLRRVMQLKNGHSIPYKLE